MSEPPTDPPIVNPGYLGGVNVVDFGDIRVARGFTRRVRSTCPHNNLRYDSNERRIWCADCESDVEAFDAFVGLIEHYDIAYKRLERRAADLAEAEKHQVRSLAAKVIDLAWRKHNMVPACPHCGLGLFPEDFKNGVRSMIGKDYARALRNRKERAP